MAEEGSAGAAEGVATEDAVAQVEGLKARLGQANVAIEEANRRALTAGHQASVATQEAEAARRAADEASRTAASSELDGANREMEGLKATYAKAFSDGDGAAIAEAQAKMARLGSRIDRLEENKRTSETRRTAPGAGGTDAGGRVIAPGPAADPREAFIASRTPLTAAWLRQHPQYFTDQRFSAKVRAADMDWEADGNAKDTPEYFAFIERRAGLTQDNSALGGQRGAGGAGGERAAAGTGTSGTAAELTAAGGEGATVRRPPRAGQTRVGVAAPPARDGGTPLSGRGDHGVKRITPEMQAWAKMMYPPTKDNPDGGISPEQYYDEYQKLVDEGEIHDRFGRG